MSVTCSTTKAILLQTPDQIFPPTMDNFFSSNLSTAHLTGSGEYHIVRWTHRGERRRRRPLGKHNDEHLKFVLAVWTNDSHPNTESLFSKIRSRLGWQERLAKKARRCSGVEGESIFDSRDRGAKIFAPSVRDIGHSQFCTVRFPRCPVVLGGRFPSTGNVVSCLGR